MKLNFRPLFIIALGCLTGLCAEAQQSSAADQTLTAEQQSRSEVFNFATRLLRQNQRENPGANLCLSPLSAQMAMAMVANGAEGATQREILDVMGWSSLSMTQVDQRQQQIIEAMQSSDDITVSLANSIWINRTAGRVKRAFVKANKTYLDAEVTRLPFNAAATERINHWCSNHTQGKISGIVDQVNSAAQMYLVNALYFKGTWLSRFNTALTRNDEFTTSAGAPVTVPMMHGQSYYDYAETSRCQLIEMPFVCVGEQQYSLYIALPNEGLTAEALLDSLDGQTWQSWVESLRSQEVKLALPKFKVEYSTLLNSALQAMGILRAFDASLADFSGITQSPLCIDMVLQKTYLDVTETGAEAAAVTAISMMRSALPAQHEVKVMRVNRPFLFMLAEKTSGTVLFAGKVENPAN